MSDFVLKHGTGDCVYRDQFIRYFSDPNLRKEYSEGRYIRCSVIKDWADQNLVGFRAFGGWSTLSRFFLHWKVSLAFVRSIQELLKRKIFLRDSYGSNVFSCFWSPRTVPGSNNFSPHSWGIGFDVNASRPRNDFGYQRKSSDPPWLDQDPELVKIFDKNGFFWGGLWGGNSTDGMHFQCSKELASNPGASSKEDCIKKIQEILRGDPELSKYLSLVEDDYYIAGWVRDERGEAYYAYKEELPSDKEVKSKGEHGNVVLEIPTPSVRQTTGKVFIFG